MTSPQYSTPYSVLTYPTYTPLSVAPVKSGGSSVWADLSLLRAAVKTDVDHQHAILEPAAQQLYTPSSPFSCGAGCAARDFRTTSGGGSVTFLSPAPQLTRVNAPLYAPPGAVKTVSSLHSCVPFPGSVAKHYSKNVMEVQGLPSATSTHQAPSRSRDAPRVVDGVEADIQSDVMSPSRVSPNLCTFRQECQSLLALLNTSSSPRRAAPLLSSTAAALDSQIPGLVDGETTSDLAGAVRQAAHQVTTLSPHESAAELSVSHVPGVDTKAAATVNPGHSTTYAQLLREVNGLVRLVKEEQEHRQQRSLATRPDGVTGATPTQGSSADIAAPVTSLPFMGSATLPTSTPEKQYPAAAKTRRHDRMRRSSPSLPLAPSTTELVHAPASPFWAAQLMKWIVYLVERRQSALVRIQAFEVARAPDRHGACAGAVAEESTASPMPSAIRTAEALLELLRSLDPSTSDVDSWTATQQRQMCTRTANLLAELTTIEERVLADVLNDAAERGAMERERSIKESFATRTASLQPASAVSEAYRQDMMDTVALLEQVSQEYSALKHQVEVALGQPTGLTNELTRELSTKAELGPHFDHLAAENNRLTLELNEMKARLRKAEGVAQPVPQEEALRNQLERQTLQLRDVRAELDDARSESNALRSTILQLREVLKRHRVVVHLLTRHRPERESAAAAADEDGSCKGRAIDPSLLESPLMDQIKGILSGACDLPSSSSLASPDRSTSSNHESPEDSAGRSSLL
ncbi:hypothetical protein JKF63_02786 [Porcisia hertigi]|uniref:Uncharacterized protein n=1 Tax=Porcisia hertigi TaxID=2761500 RepID=A0A836L845_9TRYP|nr:hypothetical protein JKF63_02786 [Porcisia hertigi]